MDALGLIRRQVQRCEAEGVSVLCCPEAILGELADDSDEPASFAIATDKIEAVLAPLASDTVTTIIGLTETDRGKLYNSAALLHRRSLAGVYRKLHPAINRSIYEPGSRIPVFQAGDLKLGIVICNDSNYFEPVRLMAAQGAQALFIPTNNALPPGKGGPQLAALARNVDIARAIENSIWVIRADVAGSADGRNSYGCSGIVDPDGMTLRSAQPLTEDLLIADISPRPRARRRG
jgi:predicted amidohydrolase